MKRIISIILPPLLLLFLVACQAKTETKYLQTSVTQEYIGNVTFRTETEYDSEGVQTAVIQYMNGEETSRMEYSYTDNSVIARTTQNGETGTMKQIYEKDESGNILRAEMYTNDELYAVTDCTYDSKGNRLTNVQHTLPIDMIFSTTYTYDNAGNQIKIVNDYGNGAGSIAENTYDTDNRLLLTMVYDLEERLTSREEHSWITDTAEHVKVYDATGAVSSTMEITYDEHGNMLTSETYDQAGALMLRVTYTYKKFEVPVK